MKKKLKYTLFLLITVPLLLEALLWIAGFRPYRITDFSISSVPENCLIADDDLGITLNPGHFEVTMNGALTYEVTHSKDFIRTYSTNLYDSSKKDLAIFGCSYTYGIGENDDDVLAALLNDQLDEFNVISFAVPSYGNVQGYIQLKELVDKGEKPDLALFNFADFHIDRNVLSPQYRLHLGIAYKRAMGDDKANMSQANFPYVRLLNDQLVFKKENWSTLYQDFPGRGWSALVNAIQTTSESIKTKNLKPIDATVALFQLIQSYCDQNDIELIVTGITDQDITREILTELNSKGLSTLYMGLPTHKKEYNHLPHDTHPNAKAHEYYAEKINSYLQNLQIARR